MKKFIVKILVLMTVFTAVLGVGVACKDKKPSSPAIEQHVITFNVDGAEYATLKTSGKEQLTLPQAPQKPSYVFDGWYMDSDYEVPFSKDSFINENLTADITVYAKWDYKKYTAKFVADGNTVSTKTFTVEDSVISDMPSVPEKDGWTGEWEEYTLSDGDITISAVYTPITYNITFVGVKGENTNKTTFTVESEDIILSDLSCEGYDFDGWYKEDAKVTKIEKGTFGNITLIARWNPITYNVTFVDVKGENTNDTTFTVEDNDIVLSDLYCDGYTFDGWYNENTKVTKINKGTIGDITLTAKWTAIVYNITFVDVKGENANDATFTVESNDIILSDLFCEGYDFDGWYKGNEKVTKINKGTIGDITLIAKWTAIVYNITFVDVKGENANKTTFTVESNDIVLSDLFCEGYAFDGWFVEDTKVTKIDKGTIGDKTLTAKWTIITYNITFEGIKGENTNKTTFTVEDNDIVLSDLSYEGYSFDGWYKGDAKVTKIEKGSYGDITLTAKWTIIVYNITFVGVKGENVNGTTFTVESEDIILSDLSCNGYTFDGWFVEDTKVTKIDKGTIGDITLTAKWTIIVYNITFEGIKGENSNGATFTVESDDIILSDLSYEGYTFEGWYNGENKVTEIEKGTIGDITLTAKWTLTEYVVTFKLDGKEIGTTTYTIENKNITLPTVDDKKGYTVVWDNYTLTTGNITINAYYQAKSVTVTFNYDGADGNNTVQSVVIGYEEKVSFPVPTKSGQTFTGWQVNGQTFNNDDVWTIDEDCTVVALWEKVKPFTRVDENDDKSDTGSFIYFGSYPQTDVTSSMSTVLADKVATLPTSENSNGWTSYKYYIESSNETDFMWYKDVEYSGSKYRAVYFTSYRPQGTMSSGTTRFSCQDENGYYGNEVYWFKFEPIKWRILEEVGDKATLLAEMILDSQDYNYTESNTTVNGQTIYTNNYEYSSIRKWLNDNFFNTAFDEAQKGIIQTVEVDNSARSTNSDNNATEVNGGVNNYACNNTNDKVWLLSEQEVTRASYGFSTSKSENNTARQKKRTGYSKCQGCWTDRDTWDYQDYDNWLLRSPSCYSNVGFYVVDDSGKSNGGYVYYTNYGVVPAIQISLSDINEGTSGGENTTTATYTRVDADGNESATGEYVLFGSYPQSDVTSSMSTVLADKVATLPTSDNSNGWTSYKYYIENSNETDFMWYKDVEYNGSKYRAVYFTSYRPENTSYDSSKYDTYQDDNGYNTSNVYWFKYEPIKWRILEESNGKATLLAEMILDSQDYYYTSSSRTIDEKTIYANNYEYSNIRKWLNDNFYNTAFSELEKALIDTVEVDNSARSANTDENATFWNSGVNKYACNNTNDKVWLLSEQEVTRESYGFATEPYTNDTVRQKKMTAYSQCQGVYTSTEPDYVGNGYWWLRSPNCDYNSYMRGGSCYGTSSDSRDVRGLLYGGVVPAIQISLTDIDEGTSGGENTTTATYTRVDADGNESATGEYVLFGSYPQSDVTSSMGTVLADKVTTLPTSDNSNGWTSYKYYIENSNETDFMWYKDVEYSGSKYRAVYFTSYRPYSTTSSSSTDNTYQDDNGYNTSNVYWFKYEPIKWRILEEVGGKATLLAEMILDSQDYNYTKSSRTIDGKTVYANNYEYSSIRAWLNDNFYNTAFSELEKALIQTVEVDNSARSTNPDSSATQWNSGVNKYACNNTNDKVWLLSEQEVTRASYGFATDTGKTATRQKKTTAYSQCQGGWTSTSSSYAGNGRCWWLRSPNYNYVHISWNVDYYGDSNDYYGVDNTYDGVVPALQISL